MPTASTNRSIRLAEIVAALSLATDLGMGHPMERSLHACVMAIRLGQAMHFDEALLSQIYYVTLLRFAGCAADARHRAAYFDHEIALGPQIDAVELWKAETMLPFLHRHVGTRLPSTERQQKLVPRLGSKLGLRSYGALNSSSASKRQRRERSQAGAAPCVVGDPSS